MHPALGLLELAVGRPEASVEALEPTVKVRADRGLADAVLPTPELPLLVEAYTRAGRRDAANDALRRFEHGADTSGRPLAHALAARCRGLLAATSEFEDEFERALVDDPLEPRPFELARTRLLYGERLRREKRGLAAREQLRAALTAFDEFGATLWSRRAAVELAATGERARRRPPPATDELTPQELVVARIVAQGKTNREVAAELFLSTNTIETHLRHIFRKLGVRSRTELAAKVTDFRDSNAAPSA